MCTSQQHVLFRRITICSVKSLPCSSHFLYHYCSPKKHLCVQLDKNTSNEKDFFARKRRLWELSSFILFNSLDRITRIVDSGGENIITHLGSKRHDCALFLEIDVRFRNALYLLERVFHMLYAVFAHHSFHK